MVRSRPSTASWSARRSSEISPGQRIVRGFGQRRRGPIGPGREELLRSERRRQSQTAAAGGLAGLHARDRVFDHKATARVQPQPPGSFEKNIGGWLLTDDILAHDDGVEGAGGEAELTEGGLDLDPIGA